MKIENIKQLQQLLKLARKEGVESMRVDGIEFFLGHLPQPTAKKTAKPDNFANLNLPPEADLQIPQYTPPSVHDQIDTDELSDEQILMWSAQGSQQ